MSRFITSIFDFENHPKNQYLLLACIILLSVVLRAYNLGVWSFWGDEFFSVSGKEDGFNYSFFRRSITQDMIRYVTSNWGISEWNARLIPAVIGVLSIIILYFIVRKMFSVPVALIFSLFMAVSPWHLYWSQNARFYVSLLLFSSLALTCFYLAFEQDSIPYLLASLLFLGLAAKERLLALMLLPVMVIYLLLVWLGPYTKPKGLRLINFLIYFSPLAVLALIFSGPYLANLSQWMQGFGWPNQSPFQIMAGTLKYVGIPLVCMAVVAAIIGFTEKSRPVLLFSLGALLPLIIMAILATFHYTANRYLFFTLPYWAGLGSLACWELYRHVQPGYRWLAIGAAAAIIVTSLGDNYLYYRIQNGNRENWKAAYSFIAERKQANDIVLSSSADLGEYYLQAPIQEYEQWAVSDLSGLGSREWFVIDSGAMSVTPQHIAWVQENARLLGVFDVSIYANAYPMRVYFYEP